MILIKKFFFLKKTLLTGKINIDVYRNDVMPGICKFHFLLFSFSTYFIFQMNNPKLKLNLNKKDFCGNSKYRIVLYFQKQNFVWAMVIQKLIAISTIFSKNFIFNPKK